MEPVEITLLIDPSLLNYFADALRQEHSPLAAEEELIDFLAAFLDDTRYPLAARRTGAREIRLSYEQKAFADPIF